MSNKESGKSSADKHETSQSKSLHIKESGKEGKEIRETQQEASTKTITENNDKDIKESPEKEPNTSEAPENEASKKKTHTTKETTKEITGAPKEPRINLNVQSNQPIQPDSPTLQDELAQKLDTIIISQHKRENDCQEFLVKRLADVYLEKQNVVQTKIDNESKEFHNKLHEGVKDAFVDFINRAKKNYQQVIAQFWTYDLARAQNGFIKEYRLILEEKDARIEELKRRLRVIAKKEGLTESGSKVDMDELHSEAQIGRG